MDLTARQVNYSLKGIQGWLASHGSATLSMVPNVGVQLEGEERELERLARVLAAREDVQLVLTPGQRRQLLALYLLFSPETVIYYKLKTLTRISRPTINKDLDAIASWLPAFGLALQRKPNYGFSITGSERDRRQALAALLWGDSSFGEPLTRVTFGDGMRFPLGRDAHLLEIVRYAAGLVARLDISRALRQVAWAEKQLGGKFVDEAVLYLALMYGLQAVRIQERQFVSVDDATLSWLKALSLWPIAEMIGKQLLPVTQPDRFDGEIAFIAIQFLTAPRNDRWPHDLETDPSFGLLVETLVDQTARAYKLPHLASDPILRDGLIAHIIPACLRQRFGLAPPPYQIETHLPDKLAFEEKVATDLANLIQIHTGEQVPHSEINNLAYLLRAAFLREFPNEPGRVIVVCPSGMATVQLLVARLKSRFPYLTNLEVVSIRELTPQVIDRAQLIITTVPLHHLGETQIDVIQVQPLLSPKDVIKITQYLSTS